MHNLPRVKFTISALSALMTLAVVFSDDAASQQSDPSDSKTQGSTQDQPTRLNAITPVTDYPALHNLLKITKKLYSGAEPKDAEAFASLAKLGIQVIVSVDGARPDLESAKKYGIQYVHIPIGYDGIEPEARLGLTRAMRDLDGPFYIHCHHGKHRGPAAAAIACVADGTMTGPEALEVLQRAGTSEGYAGLWRDVRAFEAPEPGVELPSLVEVAEVNSMAAAMARIDRAYDNLKLCQAAGWDTPKDHPDLAPAQEALLLKEGLRESARNLSEDYDEAFREMMLAAEADARRFEESLAEDSLESTTDRFATLKDSCNQCHDKYRN